MLIYIIAFFCATVFFKLSEGKKLINGYSLTAILILSFLAALRSLDVGTDTEPYAEIYQFALTQPYEALPVEPFYYVSSIIGGATFGFSYVLFIYQFLALLFVYICIWNYREKLDIWVAMLLYILFFYNVSLNIMRQATGVSYVFMISLFLKNDEIKKYLLFSVIGFIFHSSVLIGEALVFVVYLISSPLHLKAKKIYIFAYLCGLVALSIFFLRILSIFEDVSVGNVGAKVSGYVSTQSEYVSMVNFLLPLYVIFVMLFFSKRLSSYQKWFITLLAITDMTMNIMGVYNRWFMRLTYYFCIFYCLYLPMACKRRAKLKLVTLSIYTFLWFWIFVYKGSQGTIPYHFNN